MTGTALSNLSRRSDVGLTRVVLLMPAPQVLCVQGRVLLVFRFRLLDAVLRQRAHLLATVFHRRLGSKMGFHIGGSDDREGDECFDGSVPKQLGKAEPTEPWQHTIRR